MGAPKFMAGWSEAQVTSWDLQLAPVVVSLAGTSSFNLWNQMLTPGRQCQNLIKL